MMKDDQVLIKIIKVWMQEALTPPHKLQLLGLAADIAY